MTMDGRVIICVYICNKQCRAVSKETLHRCIRAANNSSNTLCFGLMYNNIMMHETCNTYVSWRAITLPFV